MVSRGQLLIGFRLIRQATALPEHLIVDLVEQEVVKQKVDLDDYDHVDPVQLSVYGHRLMGIAEQVSLTITVHRTCLSDRWGIF